MKDKQSEEALNREIREKIEEMEAADYRFPPRFTKGDYITVFLCILGCLVFLVAGAGM